jgi:hypothetical protein
VGKSFEGKFQGIISGKIGRGKSVGDGFRGGSVDIFLGVHIENSHGESPW